METSYNICIHTKLKTPKKLSIEQGKPETPNFIAL